MTTFFLPVTLYELFTKKQEHIENLINRLFYNKSAISGYICSTQDPWWLPNVDQPISNRQLQHSLYNNSTFSKKMLWYNFFNDEIWFPAYWHMWLNCCYVQKYQNILTLPYAYKTTALRSNVYHIQLHKHCFDYSNYSCILFRNVIQNMKPSTPKNNHVLRIHKVFNNAVLQLIQFLDEKGQPTNEKNAKFKEISNFLMISQTSGTLLSKKYIL